jgi:hypothetical protein
MLEHRFFNKLLNVFVPEHSRWSLLGLRFDQVVVGGYRVRMIKDAEDLG